MSHQSVKIKLNLNRKSQTVNSRVLASVSAATNCRYFFMSVVWSTTVGLGVGTNAMATAGADRAAPISTEL